MPATIHAEHPDALLWDEMIARLRLEYVELSAELRNFVSDASDRLVALKNALHELTSGAGGENICRSCGGECCRTGKYHVTVPDLLVYLARGEQLFVPSFGESRCPFSGDEGCLMPPGRRPFNCITFNCDRLEVVAEPAYLDQWRALESELRALYDRIETRFGSRFMMGALGQFKAAAVQRRPLLGEYHVNRNA